MTISGAKLGSTTNGFAPGAIAAAATSMGMIAQQVAGKAVREAVFLSTYKTHHLPHAMAAASALALITVAFMPMLTTRVAPRRLMPILFAANAAGLVLEWLLFALSHHLGALAVYLHTSVFAPVIITTFWSLINERFDPHTAKAQVARIAGGGALGGVVGGLVTWRAASLMSLTGAVLMLAVINVLCMVGCFTIPPAASKKRDSIPPTTVEEAERAGWVGIRAPLRILRDVPFLQSLAILVALGAALCSVLDYILGVQAVTVFGKGESLLQFYSLFGLAVSVISFLLQMALGRLAVEKIGLAAHIAVLPGVVIIGGALGLAMPGLATISVLRGAEMVHRNTLFRSAYELLYTPISEIQKRATKAVIDVGFDRAGTVVGSLLTMLLIYTVAGKPGQSVLLGFAMILAIATLPVVRRLHAGYVAALECRLHAEAKEQLAAPGDQGKDALSDREADHAKPDAEEPERESLIQRVAVIEPRSDDEHVLARAMLERPEVLREMADDLLSRDPQRTRGALERLDGETRMAAGFAILLLADKEFHLDARKALRRLAPMVRGQLVDALLEPEMDYAVRRRIPPILAADPSQCAVLGLCSALADVRFEVRYAAGRALMRMMDRNPKLELPEKRIVKLILNEIEREKKYVAVAAASSSSSNGSSADDVAIAEDEITAPLDVVTRDRVSRGLEHVFTLLALLLGSEAVRLCFRALHEDDDSHRGTALEYLQTVLPTEIRDAVWPLLGEIEASGVVPSVRSPKEVLSDLTRAMSHERTARTAAAAAASGGSKKR